MEKQVNSRCKSCYYKIGNVGFICKHLNDEIYKSLLQALIIYRLDYGNALLYNISLSLTNRLQRVQNCATRLVTHSQNETYKTSFVPAVLVSCTFQITVQDLSPTHFWVYKKAIQPRTEINPSEHQLPGCGTSCQNHIKHPESKDICCQVLKIHLFKLASLLWNVFVLYELKICFNYVLNVKCLRAIQVE